MSTEAILLGVSQDAGFPQAGCYCAHCSAARTDPALSQYVVSLGLVDRKTSQSWLIDATPDFRQQLHALHEFAPDCPLAGIVLTHAHMGHYTGLIHLGMEAMNVRELPLYVTARMAEFLQENEPWSYLITHGHVTPRLLTPAVDTRLSSGLRLTPYPVPHRDEFSDTLAIVVRGAERQLFYCPDIDDWDAWEIELRPFLAGMDIALLDAPFFSPDELPHRDMSQIRHPMAVDTVKRLSGVDCQILLVHLNHSNPLLMDSPERAWVQERGAEVGYFGQQWRLG